MAIIKLVNLDNFETILAGSESLKEYGIPHGYKIADDITTTQWIEICQELVEYKIAADLRSPIQ